MNSSSVPQSKITPSSQPPSKPNWILRAQNQQPLENPKLRLLCIPHAGSGAFVYHAWNGHLPDGVEVLPIEVPGRNTRRKEDPPNSISDFAKDFVDALGPEYLSSENTTAPYALFGHSLGAWMAYAIIQELQQRNKNYLNSGSVGGGGNGTKYQYQYPIALFVSGTRSPKLAGVQHDPDGVEMYKLDGPTFWQIFEKRYGQNPDLADPSVREFFRPKLQQDFKLGETYRPISPSAPLPCPLYVSVGAEDPRCVNKEIVEAWKDCCELSGDNKIISDTNSTINTSTICQVRYFPGGHHYLLNEEESKLEFLIYLSDTLDRILLKKDDGIGELGVDIVEKEEGVMPVPNIITLQPSNSSENGINNNNNNNINENTTQQNVGPGIGAGGGGGGPGSVRSMSSDAGATVASGSSYAAAVGGAVASNPKRGLSGLGRMSGGVGGGVTSGSMVRSMRGSVDGRSDRDDLEGHDGGEGEGVCGRMTCCCF